MTVYVDDPMDIGGKFHNYCHMWSDTDLSTCSTSVLAVVRFARQVFPSKSIKELLAWLQYSHGLSGDFWHYDVAPSYRPVALKLGAQYMPLKDWVRRRMIERDAVNLGL